MPSKRKAEDDRALLQQIRDANSAAGAQLLEHLVVQRRSTVRMPRSRSDQYAHLRRRTHSYIPNLRYLMRTNLLHVLRTSQYPNFGGRKVLYVLNHDPPETYPLP